MPPKSIFRQPGAKHFQLVHRSQRDPLIHDPDASDHVLKHVVRENAKKGKSRADLESLLSGTEFAADLETKAGEAANYGVFYDDTEYNYMQHLRPVGVQEDGVDSVLIDAPSTLKKPASKFKAAGKRADPGITLKDLPQGVLPSTSELPRTYESQQAVPASISGFQPDMDPHLRQVLEALEDDAFVDDGLEDDFFGELVKEGERGSDEEPEFEFYEDGSIEDRTDEGAAVEEGEEDSWEQRFAQFKQQQKDAPRSAGSDDEGEFGTERADTVSGLPTITVIGGKKRRKGSSDATGYSMSSSSMFRNEALQTLDQRFDQVMLKEYNSEDDEESEGDPFEDASDEEAPQLITSRTDFNSMMDEFLNDYEILGRKMKQKLPGETGMEKLDTFRRALGQDERVRDTYDDDSDNDDYDDLKETEKDQKDRWDCETILTTYSNLENHPRLLRARDVKPVPRILLDPKTGLPSVVDQQPPSGRLPKLARKGKIPDGDATDESDSDSAYPPRHHTVTRPRDESPESKKARKASVKAERAARRADKKATKEVFGSEIKIQQKTRLGKTAERGMKKL